MKIYNEVGFSFVLWKGNWIWISYEQEFDNGEEKRWWWWKKLWKIEDVYVRIWIYKKVFIFSKKDGIKTQNKNKRALKIILWFSN